MQCELPAVYCVFRAAQLRVTGMLTSAPLPALTATHILSSMQYTAEGSDLLGAFTRATFCTVVSRSPEDREVVIPRRPTPQADIAKTA